jgi:hypothetical protein
MPLPQHRDRRHGGVPFPATGEVESSQPRHNRSMSRAMSDQERALLLYLLRHERPGYLALREQVAVAIHEGYWFEQSLSFDISLPPTGPTAPVPDGPHADGDWAWTDDDQPVGHFLIWVEGGRLAALEYGWVTDEMPSDYPPLARDA